MMYGTCWTGQQGLCPTRYENSAVAWVSRGDRDRDGGAANQGRQATFLMQDR
jgi:hypothetical protein